MARDAGQFGSAIRVGAVSYLNAQPLVDGLDHDRIALSYDVPAALSAALSEQAVDVALVPVVDVLRSRDWTLVSDACIGCDGPTMTVRVFAQQPPETLDTLCVDTDSHTSVALARVLWQNHFARELEIIPLAGRDPREQPAVLLIGDKVMQFPADAFGYHVDLGELWQQHTGLPFMFAAWATRPATATNDWLPAELSQARDRGVARAVEIAEQQADARAWPVAAAREYLTRCLRFRIDERMRAGATRFAADCARLGLVPVDATVRWDHRYLETPTR